ncbi:uncharacterized protein LOC125239467 isoform X1 [Leguminivora glycinivorella]|uniref:uncharacterized protein LOC125239467 isoform X1 n=1 Tax=Leguminivora glycinivorella TaxID=1035111 RepID=UPI0020103368|nr:uncharacterized protein LOC125239467 isoform X1 [Leguminivora glycinivorella]
MNRLIFIIPMIRVAWSHDKFTHVYYEQAIGANMENISWDPELNGRDDTYMAFTAQWKKEIILWAKDCIFDIKNSMNQLDQINWNAQDDPRHVYGITMGRMLEMHRQQMDMYRRMKRVVENKFTWLRPEISGYYPQLSGQNGVVEPGNGSFDPLEYGREWAKGGKKTFFDYKPHVYIMALEYITKRGIEIEHLVKLLTLYTGEEEVGRFPPQLLPGQQDMLKVFQSYSTRVPKPGYAARKQGAGDSGRKEDFEEDRKQEEEEAFKAKMREEYYKKHKHYNK